MMNEGLSCSTNLEANSNFTSSNSGADGRDGIWANSSTAVHYTGLGLGDIRIALLALRQKCRASHCELQPHHEHVPCLSVGSNSFARLHGVRQVV